jgi:2'-hydroxyisoflavone reductase
MNILIIGGTKFLGRHLVDAATQSGHAVTLFNRGQTNPGLFPDIETITGDRQQPADLAKLQTRRWDAVIDTCGYVPRIVRMSAEALKDSVDQYVFISSISVYPDFSQPGIDESHPVGKLDDENVKEITHETYGPLKALCEQAVDEILPGKGLQVRPGLIVGPYDPTDRFTYWPARVERGGRMVVPDYPDCPVQIIDGRDLGEWIIRMVEEKAMGTINVTGPEQPHTLTHVLNTCQEMLNTDVDIEWVDEQFLLDNDVAPWTGMPLWMPSIDDELAGFGRVSIDRALGKGLTFRSLSDTIQATMDWVHQRPDDWEWRAGISPEKEAEVLAAWDRHSQS